jgi:hypothetical protein
MPATVADCNVQSTRMSLASPSVRDAERFLAMYLIN